MVLGHDYRGGPGCCLTCEHPSHRKGWNSINREGCLCADCKCKKCSSYNSYHKKCEYTIWYQSHDHELILIERETEKAIKARATDGEQITPHIWIPKKAIMKKGKKFFVANWLLMRKGFLREREHSLETNVKPLKENIEYTTYLPKNQNGEEEKQNGKQTNLHIKN